MNKKAYQTPCVIVITIAAHQLVCLSSVNTPIAGEEETPPGGWEPAQSPHRRSSWRSPWE
ncbi:MAG: hypothetical protein IKX69_01335 [Prevotella sp.]|nr:hypothetical protein [Prevotella sp.]